MSHYTHHAVSYPPPVSTPPPPMGYPTMDGPTGYTQTTTRGDGFWKGCCAALCCCFALDVCI